MFVCKKCGKAYQIKTNFCPDCGGEVVETYSASPSAFADVQNEQTENAAPAAPVQTAEAEPPKYYAQPIFTAPPSAPAPSGGAKAKGIISMALGIEGLFSAFISFVMVSLLTESRGSHIDFVEISTFVIAFSITCIGIGIAGLILSASSRRSGFLSGISMTGKVLNIISVILHGIFFLAACGMLSR